ncbi:MAG: aspartate--tRNA ligase [Actinobacteria bacterium]|nr:MAG: aspartate--tRNA ligase [Actinomycetota bacterium]
MKPPRANGYRDAWCGGFSAGDTDAPARVAGWVHRRRDHGGVVFIDLRDRSGLLQLVFHPDRAPEAHQLAHRLRPEDVLSAAGTIVRRDPENVNPQLPTGEVELAVSDVEILSDADTPPFPIDEEVAVDEVLRLRHRALDLRREGMAEMLALRHRVIAAMRAYLDERDFLEVETPILTRSTPEGARDFLVPARISPGTFFALPQSPQLFKQLLMIAGAERYYQIARCFRDEDSRADRQPEFTQLDIEMSFVEEDDVIELIEGLMHRVLSVGGLGLPAPPWPRLPHAEAMERYGSDRPDLRFGMEIHDVSELVQGSDFKVFENVLGSGAGVVRALNAGPQGAAMSRHELDELNEFVQAYGARATAPMPVTEEGWGSNLAKFFSPEQVAAVNQRLGASPGDLLLFVADRASVAAAALGALRLELGHRFGLVPAGRHQVSWVVDFPMFEYDEAEGRWDPLHHPFTQPTGDLADPGALRARAYDLTIDGWEMGGGSIRIHSPEVQREVFRAIGISDQEAQERFGFLLDALRYGAPPHGGIAFGIDRIVALLGGRESIRDAIAFPKTASGLDPLTGAPAAVDERQLRELGVRLAGGAPRTGDAGTR